MSIGEDSYKIAVEGAEYGIWEFNVVKKTLTCSAMLKVMIGHPPYKTLESMEDWEEIISPIDLQQFRVALEEHIHEYRPLKIDIRVLTKNREEKMIRFKGASQIGPSGDTERICALVHVP